MDKQAFIRQLAEFLVGDQVKQGIDLQFGKPSAKAWAQLRSTTPLRGYPTVDEATKDLENWLLK